jgi:hypothetical protein
MLHPVIFVILAFVLSVLSLFGVVSIPSLRKKVGGPIGLGMTIGKAIQVSAVLGCLASAGMLIYGMFK